jgi:hypothetical protein
MIGAVTFAVGLPAAFAALGNRGADDAPVHLALYAGWTKARTLASTGWLLLAAVALTVIVSATVAAAARWPSVARHVRQVGAMTADWPGHHRPASPSHQTMGRPRRARPDGPPPRS